MNTTATPKTLGYPTGVTLAAGSSVTVTPAVAAPTASAVVSTDDHLVSRILYPDLSVLADAGGGSSNGSSNQGITMYAVAPAQAGQQQTVQLLSTPQGHIRLEPAPSAATTAAVYPVVTSGERIFKSEATTYQVIKSPFPSLP